MPEFVLRVVGFCGIVDTIYRAIVFSLQTNCPVSFEFNGVEVTVDKDSKPELIYRDWSRAVDGYIAKKIGPDSAVSLTEKEKAFERTRAQE